MTDAHQPGDQARALLAIQLGSAHPGPDPGPPASDAELAQLVEQRLPFARRQQVIRQLLDNPTLFQQWLNLAEAAHGLMPATTLASAPPRLRLWSWLGGGLALAGAFSLGLMLAPSSAPPGQLLIPGETHQPAERAGTADYQPGTALKQDCVPLTHPASGLQGELCRDPDEPDVWHWRAAERPPR